MLVQVFDNLFTGRSLAQIGAEASLTDPFIGGKAGFVQAGFFWLGGGGRFSNAGGGRIAFYYF